MKTITIALTTLGLAACLQDKAPLLDCGQGDAFSFSGTNYCMYYGAIIIEGFDCPPEVPFGHETDGVMVCSPTDDAPDGGWQQLVDDWRNEGHEPSDATDTSEDTTADTQVDTGPSLPALCISGLQPGQCWTKDQCPVNWACDAGPTLSCTPCADCAEPISATPGTCRPEGGVDAIGLVPWPNYNGAAGDVPLAYWFVANSAYTLLECPSYGLEIEQPSTEWIAGPNESACSGPTVPPNGTMFVRPGPDFGNTTPVTVRARGHYRTGCGGSDPSTCSGSVEVGSVPIVLRGQ